MEEARELWKGGAEEIDQVIEEHQEVLRLFKAKRWEREALEKAKMIVRLKQIRSGITSE